VLTAAAYAFFGSSNQLCVGPVALVSLLTAQLINQYNIDYVNDPQLAIDFAGEIAIAVGIVLIILSLLNMGNLIRFISHPVMSGFTTGAAALIGLNQIKSAFGFTLKVPQQGQPEYEFNYQVMQWIMQNWNKHYHFTDAQITKKPSLGLQDGRSVRNPLAAQICFGLYIPLIFIVIIKNNIKATPERKKSILFHIWTVCSALMPFVAVIIGAHIAWQIKHDDHYNDPKEVHQWYAHKLAIVGEVKPGLDFLSTPKFPFPFLKLVGNVFQIALIAYMESYGVAQRVAHQNHEFHLLNASQELWAIGVANVLASCSSSYPVAGSFSRTSLNAVSGARTPLSKIVNMFVIILALGTLTKTFQYIPNAALAAIIWVAVFNLISITDFWNTWKHSKKDFMVMLITLVFVFVLNTEYGLAIGIGVSVFIYLMDSTFNPENGPELLMNEEYMKNNEINHIRLRGDFNFLTSGRILDLITSLTLIDMKKPDVIDSSWGDRVHYRISSGLDAILKPQLVDGVQKLPKAVVLDMEVTRVIDITALHDIEEQAKNCRQKKILFVVINASPVVTKSLMKFGFKNDDLIGTVDYSIALKYNRLAGNQIPKIPSKKMESIENSSEGDNISSMDDGASEIQLIGPSMTLQDNGHEGRKDV
jgi:MFS superfamily sulfate permease-like transporter